MDHKKKKAGAAVGGKQKPSTSANTNKKIEVHRHFDPKKTRCKRSTDFPEILLDEPETITLLKAKTGRQKKKNPTSVSNLKPRPIYSRNRSCSCEKREPYCPDSYMSSQTSTNQLKTTRSPNSQACIDSSNASMTKNHCRQKSELVYKTISNNSSHASITKPQKIQTKKKPSSTNKIPQIPKTPSTPTPVYQNEEFFCKFKDPVVQQLKYEIGLSKAFCSEEVKNTVVELKAEIAKYRQSLNKNVNLLQGKLDPSMFARNTNGKENKQITTETQTDRRDGYGDDIVEAAKDLQEVDNLMTTLNGLLKNADQVSGTRENLAARKEREITTLTLVDQPLTKSSKDQGTNNPKQSLNSLVDKSIEVDHLKHQKENIEKVDFLIVQAEKSLKAIRKEFYGNIDVCPAPPASKHSKSSTTEEEEEDPITDKDLSLHSSRGDHGTIKPSIRIADVLANKEEIMRLIELKCQKSSEISLSERELSKSKSTSTKSSTQELTASSEEVSRSKIIGEILAKEYDVTSDTCAQKKPCKVQSKMVGKHSGSLKSSSCFDVLTDTKQDKKTSKPIVKAGKSTSSVLSGSRKEGLASHKTISKSSYNQLSIPEDNPPVIVPPSQVTAEPSEAIKGLEMVSSCKQELSDDSDCSCPVEEVPLKIPEKELYPINLSTLVGPIIPKDDYQPSQDDDPAYCTESDARLNTISERTEMEEPEYPKAKKEVKLMVQHMPIISIRPPLQFQKVFQMDIKPSVHPKLTMSPSQNVYYKELKHEELLCFCPKENASEEVLGPPLEDGNEPVKQPTVYLDVVSPVEVVLGIQHTSQPVILEDVRKEVLKEFQMMQIPDNAEARSSKDTWLSLFSEKGRSVTPSDHLQEENLSVVTSQSLTDVMGYPDYPGYPEYPDFEDPTSKDPDLVDPTSKDRDFVEPKPKDCFDRPVQSVLSRESGFQRSRQLKIIRMEEDLEESDSPKSIHEDASTCLSLENVTYVNESFKPNSESAGDLHKLQQNIPSDGIKGCPCIKSVCQVEEFSSDTFLTENTNSGKVGSMIRSDSSSESIYLVTHDVGTQISREDIEFESLMMKLSTDKKSKIRVAIDPELLKTFYERSATGDMPDSKENPEEIVQKQDENEKKVDEIVKKQDEIQKTQEETKKQLQETQKQLEETQNQLEETQKAPEEHQKRVKPSPKDQTEKKSQETQTTLNMVGLHFEDKEIQKGMDESSYGYAKLHKAKICKDYETSSNDSLPKEPLRNIPFGDAFPSTAVYKADDFASTSTPELMATKSMKAKRGHSSKQSTSSSTSDDYNLLEDTMSDGEVKCKCSVSIGELHLCRFANEIKTRANYLKRHPEKMLQRDLPGPHVEVVKQRAYFDNWISYTYFTSSSASPVDNSDISRET